MKWQSRQSCRLGVEAVRCKWLTWCAQAAQSPVKAASGSWRCRHAKAIIDTNTDNNTHAFTILLLCSFICLTLVVLRLGLFVFYRLQIKFGKDAISHAYGRHGNKLRANTSRNAQEY